MYKPSEQNAIGVAADRSKASWAYSNVPTFAEYKHLWDPELEEAALQGCREPAAVSDGQAPRPSPKQS